MDTTRGTEGSERFTRLSDRFRALWTFYQFLTGVYRHLGRGELPVSYDFQALYRRLQAVAPRLAVESDREVTAELDAIERELRKLHARLAEVDRELPPSVLRRFFDRLQRQDEKVLFVLAKFYLQSREFDRDTLDKLDILFTRAASAPLDDGRALPKDPGQLRATFGSLLGSAGLPPLDEFERRALVEGVREIRAEIEGIHDFTKLLDSGVLDRLRQLKHGLGRSLLDPDLLVEVVITNIVARNRFEELYREEEVKILEDTNRIFEIERYLERNPEFATADLRDQIAAFRRYRSRFDSGRKGENLKREDILELLRATRTILDRFDQEFGTPAGMATPPAAAPPATASAPAAPEPADARPAGGAAAGTAAAVEPSPPPEPQGPAVTSAPAEERASTTASVAALVNPDPLLNEALHKIMFALELVAWEHEPEQAVRTSELHNLRLEPWEVRAYRRLADRELADGTLAWELARFYLESAALRVRMDEERAEIERRQAGQSADRLLEVLERSTQSLERARDVDRRFRWFIEDFLYRGDTDGLEEIYRSHFRFLASYAALWLVHQEAGGITPL